MPISESDALSIRNYINSEVEEANPLFSSDTFTAYKVKVDGDIFPVASVHPFTAELGNSSKKAAAKKAISDKVESVVSSPISARVPLNVFYRPLSSQNKIVKQLNTVARPTVSESVIKYNGNTYSVTNPALKLVNSLWVDGHVLEVNFLTTQTGSYIKNMNRSIRNLIKNHHPLYLFNNWILEKVGEETEDLIWCDGSGNDITLTEFYNISSSFLPLFRTNTAASWASSNMTWEQTLPSYFSMDVKADDEIDMNALKNALKSGSPYNTLFMALKIRDYLGEIMTINGGNFGEGVLPISSATAVHYPTNTFARSYESPPYGATPHSSSFIPIHELIAIAIMSGLGIRGVGIGCTFVSHSALSDFVFSIPSLKNNNSAVLLSKSVIDELIIEGLYVNSIDPHVLRGSVEWDNFIFARDNIW